MKNNVFIPIRTTDYAEMLSYGAALELGMRRRRVASLTTWDVQ